MEGALVRSMERHWEDGWNAEDLDVIMEPMAASIVFSSPYVRRFVDSDSIRGYDELRSYLADALARTPGIRYRLTSTYVGSASLVLTYEFTKPDGVVGTGADFMKLDSAGKIVDWSSHYPVRREGG